MAVDALRVRAADVVARVTDYGDHTVFAGKLPLMPGATGTSANVTNKDYGLPSVSVDIDALPGAVGASDVILRTGNSMDPGSWGLVGGSPTVTVLSGGGQGGSDRVVIELGAAVENAWLQTTVLPTAATGLASPDATEAALKAPFPHSAPDGPAA